MTKATKEVSDMTLKDLLVKKNIKFTEVGIDDFVGTTEKGTYFHLYRTGGAGMEVALRIDDKFITHCKWQTAFKKIKTL